MSSEDPTCPHCDNDGGCRVNEAVLTEAAELAQHVRDEKRPVDRVNEATGVLTEAAELAEHIRDADPDWQRERLMSTLLEMIDDAHKETSEAYLDLEGELKDA